MRGPDRKSVRTARRLRADQTMAEAALWKRVRNRQLSGFKFVRQEPLEGFVCDFVCRERMLIVELDGGQHNGSTSDRIRDAKLEARGYRVIRFWNNDVLGNIEGVLTVLDSVLKEEKPLTPTLSP